MKLLGKNGHCPFRKTCELYMELFHSGDSARTLVELADHDGWNRKATGTCGSAAALPANHGELLKPQGGTVPLPFSIVCSQASSISWARRKWAAMHVHSFICLFISPRSFFLFLSHSKTGQFPPLSANSKFFVNLSRQTSTVHINSPDIPLTLLLSVEIIFLLRNPLVFRSSLALGIVHGSIESGR